MSSDIGSEIPVKPRTMEGRDWPCLRQFCVFLENRVGCLHELLKLVERDALRVVSLSVVDSVDFAVARMIVDNNDLTREILTLNGFTFFENDIIGVELGDDAQPYIGVLSGLLQAEINIDYTYPLLFSRSGRKAIAIKVEDVDAALRLLQSREVRVLKEADFKDPLEDN